MCIAIIYSTCPNRDPDRLRRLFLRAMSATGSSVAHRRSELFDNGNDGFHFVVWGDDSLDCHVHTWPVLEELRAFPLDAHHHPAITAINRESYTCFIIEPSPLHGPPDAVEMRRVALAAAELIDDTALAILDRFGGRLERVNAMTADRLRSDDPGSAFADAIILPRHS